MPSIDRWYPLHIPCLELCISFNCCNGVVALTVDSYIFSIWRLTVKFRSLQLTVIKWKFIPKLTVNINFGMNFEICWDIKEQYPVTAHAPNFDFWTGCREIKRCEESKRTLKNPFASRLAEFNTTLKLFRITDQWYIVPGKFQFGRNLDFFGVNFITVGRRTRRWQAL